MILCCMEFSAYEWTNIILSIVAVVIALASLRTARKSIDIARQSASDTANQTSQQIAAIQLSSIERSAEADEQIKTLKKEIALQGNLSVLSFELERSKIEYERFTAENEENFLKKKVEEFAKAGTHSKLEMDELNSQLTQLHTRIENLKRMENRIEALAHDAELYSRNAQSGW